MVKKHILPLAGMERLMKSAGADRVSEDSKVELRDVLEDIAFELSQKAMKFSIHAGRKTIKAEDIKLASKERT
ncbi:MAG: histone family protein [Nanoarchaeota archaeon]|nr:histone family protein [Nanoarchaeota archaeon]